LSSGFDGYNTKLLTKLKSNKKNTLTTMDYITAKKTGKKGEKNDR
jgi:hypothetical protein